MQESLQRQLLSRIDADRGLSTEAGILILAACEGEAALSKTLEGEADEARLLVDSPTETAIAPSGAYLGPVSVEGFRGIGQRALLPLIPAPGLTLVIGRNGSGKSSFAEAMEVLLTGNNLRWAERHAVWREGWRNLHHSSSTDIAMEMAISSRAGKTIATRSWLEGAPLDKSVAELQTYGQPKADLSSLGWDDALVKYRPFLSYNELGSMFDDVPSHLYDALSSVLGLEDLSGVEKLLGDARRSRESSFRTVKQDLAPLLVRLGELEDSRAQDCHRALAGRRWDLDRVEEVVLGRTGATDGDSNFTLLQSLAALQPPDPDGAQILVVSLREAAAAIARTMSTDADRNLKLAVVLQGALDLHSTHGDRDCPVCARPGALDVDWRAAAEKHVADLRESARAATESVGARDAAMRSAMGLLSGPPQVLLQASQVGIDASAAITTWSTWAAGSALDDPEALAGHIEQGHGPLATAINDLRRAALQELDRRQSEWRPVAAGLMEWLPRARVAQDNFSKVPALKTAEAWIKSTSGELRDERFQPIADEARRIWDILKLRSNVELGRPELDGTGTRRRVRLDVTVDGASGAALAVMSQGELHCLALSLFIPRATLPESPFRFLVIDDPVQSMDPSRVDGLARLLHEVGRARQVVVFTHDDRLPESVRRLGIDASVIEVTRQSGSVVTVAAARGPIERNLEDARALANDTSLPAEIAQRVIPGFCRAAVEAACAEAVRRRRIGRGADHAELEGQLAPLTAMKLVALALFDDETRGGEVLAHLNRRYGPWAADALQAMKEGAHGSYLGGLKQLITDSGQLAAGLRQEK
jgi:energy-coupling factor transporter ATP-binding protein EcfA2